MPETDPMEGLFAATMDAVDRAQAEAEAAGVPDPELFGALLGTLVRVIAAFTVSRAQEPGQPFQPGEQLALTQNLDHALRTEVLRCALEEVPAFRRALGETLPGPSPGHA